MYPVSSTVAQLYAAEQRQVLRITGTDKNGAAISITDADIMLNSFSIDRYSCTGKRLQVGTAVSSEMSLKLNNSDGKYNSIVFENAELYAEIGIRDWNSYTSAYMTQGATTTRNGITFSVEPDGRLKLYGTATANRRILCLNGQNAIVSTVTAYDQTFAAGTYDMRTSIDGHYTGNLIWYYTRTTYSEENIAAISMNNPSATVTFDAPVMFGLGIPNGTDLGTADDPTYVTFTAESPAIEWMPCGYFTPDEQPRTRDFITLSALDRMMRFDITPFDATDLTFPTTVAALVAQVAGICNVPFTQNISSLPNASFTIQSIPATSQEITYRNIIQWCAGLMATNAFIDWNGELQFKWYTLPSSVYASTPALRYSSDHDEDNITIPGITYKDSEDVVHVAGTNTYPIDMSDNLLVAANIDSAIQAVSLQLRNFTYRPFEAQTVNAPFLWPMDKIRFTPTGSTLPMITIVTNVNFGINGKMALAAKGETTKAASYQSPSGFTSAQQQQIERLQQLSHEAIETAVDNATIQITGGTGDSHWHFIYDNTTGGLQEIVVSNETDYTLSTAKVWRWNSHGLGFSSTGYAGPYDLALTQDGSIVATLITTGILNANVIKAGIIEDVTGASSWNLVSGAMNLSGSFKTTTVDSTTGEGIRAEISDGVFKLQSVETQEPGIIANDSLEIHTSADLAGELNPPYSYRPVSINAREASGVNSEIFMYCGNGDFGTLLSDSRPYIRIGRNKIVIRGPIEYENV